MMNLQREKKLKNSRKITFVKQDVENGYALLADGTKRYVSQEQFKIVLSKLHPKAFPKTVTALNMSRCPVKKRFIFSWSERIPASTSTID